MPKSHAKRVRELARLREKQALSSSTPASKKKHKRRRLTDGLIGLSSAAVLTVYGLGYLHTQDANGDFSTSNVVFPSPTSAPNHGPVGVPTATPAPGAGSYRDGTYVGTGTSRHGDIQATVVVQNGRVVSANVTGCGTRYPCSDVSPLIREVVSRQGTPVDHVSGATDSSHAYTQAIQNALAQAS